MREGYHLCRWSFHLCVLSWISFPFPWILFPFVLFVWSFFCVSFEILRQCHHHRPPHRHRHRHPRRRRRHHLHQKGWWWSRSSLQSFPCFAFHRWLLNHHRTASQESRKGEEQINCTHIIQAEWNGNENTWCAFSCRLLGASPRSVFLIRIAAEVSMGRSGNHS